MIFKEDHNLLSGIQQSISEKTFITKVMIARELQDMTYASEEAYVSYRNDLVAGMHKSVEQLNNDSFRVKQHLRYVEKYRCLPNWNDLDVKTEIAPIITLGEGDELAKRFDYLMYSMILGYIQSKSIARQTLTVVGISRALSKKMSIPAVKAQIKLIEDIQENEFWENIDIFQMERVKDALRDLLQYLDIVDTGIVYIDTDDEIIDVQEGAPLTGESKFENYKKKVEYYLKEHKDNLAVYKLYKNKKLTEQDLKTLEKVLWEELGSREDYLKEYGETPVCKLVRKIVGVDREAVNEAFSEFLTEERLNLKQLRFVNLIVDYIVANGNIEDNSVLMRDPFKTAGGITVLFKNDMDTAKKIMNVVAEIKENSEVWA